MSDIGIIRTAGKNGGTCAHVVKYLHPIVYGPSRMPLWLDLDTLEPRSRKNQHGTVIANPLLSIVMFIRLEKNPTVKNLHVFCKPSLLLCRRICTFFSLPYFLSPFIFFCWLNVFCSLYPFRGFLFLSLPFYSLHFFLSS